MANSASERGIAGAIASTETPDTAVFAGTVAWPAASAATHARTASSGLPAPSGPTVTISQPDSVAFHTISDDQLEMFEMNDSDGFGERMWAAFSVAGGASPGAFASLYDWLIKDAYMTVVGQFQIVILTSGIAAFLVYYSLRKNRRSRTSKLVSEIRSRPTQPLYIISASDKKP
jgi:hypothetical protein